MVSNARTLRSHRSFVGLSRVRLKIEGTGKEHIPLSQTLSPDRGYPVRGMAANNWQLGSCPNMIYNKASVSQGFL